MLTALLNPWVLLGGLLALLGAFSAGYASNDGAERVQAAWDQANVAATAARQKRIDAAREAQDRLQAEANEDRRKRDEERKRMDARLVAALGELRKRPARPEPWPAVSQPAGLGAEGGGCTGAGLYRDDAEFLARHADLAQRIRAQRDACYAEYWRAQSEIRRLNGR